MLSHAIEVLGWTLLHFVWQGAVVGVLAAAMLLTLRRCSANARYLTAVSALGLMLLLPLGTITWIEQTPPVGEVSPIFNTVSMIEIPRTRDNGTLALDEPPIKVERIGIDFENPPPADAVPLIPVSDAGKTILEDLAEQRSAFDAESFLKPFIPWAVAVWLTGVGVLSLRLFASWLSVLRLRRRATQPASADWQAMLGRLAERLRVTRPVKLVESALVEVPAVIGWMRPVILLPASAMTGLTTEQLEALLAHELAHVRRHDYLINLLQTVVETLLFYHPTVWWVSHRIRVEREHCCDDLAASVCGDRLSYAQALVAMEELRAPKIGLVMSSSGGSLLTRVARMLGQAEQQRRSTGWVAGFLSLVLLTMAGAFGTRLLTSADEPGEKLLKSDDSQSKDEHGVENDDQVAATVNGVKILEGEVLEPFGEQLAMLRNQSSPAEYQKVRRELLERHVKRHIERQLLVQESDRAIWPEGRKEVDRAAKEQFDEHVEKLLRELKIADRKQLDQQLKNRGTSLALIEADILREQHACQFLGRKYHFGGWETGGDFIDQLWRQAEIKTTYDVAKGRGLSDELRDPQNQRVREELRRPTEIDFSETPLSDTLRYLSDYHNLVLKPDAAAIPNWNTVGQTPVSLTRGGEPKLEAALGVVLASMLEPLQLTYRVSNGELLITTSEDFQRRGEKLPVFVTADAEVLNTRIRNGLLKPTDAAFHESRLVDVILFFSDYHEICIGPDLAAISNWKEVAETPITLEFREDALGVVLNTILKPLRLRYRVHNGELLVTTFRSDQAAESRDQPEKPTNGLPNSGNDNQREKTKEGDLRSSEAAGSGDPRGAQTQTEHERAKLQVLRQQAENDIHIRFAEKSAEVAKAEWEKMVEANRKVPGSIPATEIERVSRDYNNTVLQIEKAQHEQRIHQLELELTLGQNKDDWLELTHKTLELRWLRAKEAADLAKGEHDRISDANRRVPGTIPEAEVAKARRADEAARSLLERAQIEFQIDAELTKLTEVAFTDTPLADVAMFLSDYHNIPVELDATAKKFDGSPVTLTVTCGDLAEVLSLALHPMKLSYCIDGGRLLIATPEEVQRCGHKLPRSFADELAVLLKAESTIAWESLLRGSFGENDFVMVAPKLSKLLDSDDVTVQRYAARGLVQFDFVPAQARPRLEKLTRSKDTRVARGAWLALVTIGHKDFSTLPLMLAELDRADKSFGQLWPVLLAHFDESVWDELTKAFPTSSPQVRAALAASVRNQTERSLPVALLALEDAEHRVRRTALNSIRYETPPAKLVSAIQARLKDEALDIRVQAAGRLLSYGKDVNEAVELLLSELEQVDQGRASIAMRNFLQVHSPEATRAIVDALDAPSRSKDASRRREAWRVLMFVNLITGMNHPHEVPWGPTRAGLRTRLSEEDSKSDRPPYKAFAGEPIKLKLELKTFGDEPVEYDAQQAGVNQPLIVFDDEMRPVKYIGPQVATSGSKQTIKPGETHVLVEQLDLTAQYDLKQPGKYYIQWTQGSRAIAPDDAKTPFVPNSNVLALEIQKAEANENRSGKNGYDAAKLERPSPKVQGEILSVNFDNGLVTISLGEGDGIKTRTKFKVRQKSNHDDPSSPPVEKGTIEIVRVIDRQTSEARILGLVYVGRLAKGDEVVPLDETKEPNDEPRRTPAAKRNSVRERLQNRISLSLENVPLNQVVEHIGREAKIAVRLDSDALENDAIPEDTPVSISVDGISTAGALRLLLQPISLSYLIENETLVVTTVARLAKTPVEERLDLGKTLADEAKMSLLKDAIQSFVEPKTWDVAGGPGSIRFNASREEFVIRHVPLIQHQVDRFLTHVVSRPPSPEMQRLRKLLSQRFTLDLGEVTLLDAAGKIAMAVDANVLLDMHGLASAGVRSNRRVTLNHKDTPLRDILDGLCKPLKLRFRIEDEVIKITDEETALGGFFAVLYPISAPADDLANRLQKSIRSASWKSAGGQGTIEPHRPTNSLIIRQHEEVHDEIAEFFAKLPAQDLKSEISNLKSQISDAKTNDVKPAAQLKGRIHWIEKSKGMVWISLGYADGVARPMRFQVREKADPKNGNQPQAVKGKIEVSRVIDAHTSEARIILDDLNNAVAKGDEIVQLFETTQPNDKPNEEQRKLPPPKGEIYDAASPGTDRIKPKQGSVSGAISGKRRDRDSEMLDQFTGRVRLKTEKPLPDLEKVVVPAGKVLDESLVFSKDGGLANVFVYLQKPTFPIEPPPSNRPPKPFILIAEGGKFWPHAAFVRVGRPLVFENRQTDLVNFFMDPQRNVSFNVVAKVQDQVKLQALRTSEKFPFAVKSTIQPWMQSHLLTLDHPFAAVTDEEGRFAINGLPPGEHEFHVWHERVGYLEKKLAVTIKAGEPARIQLEYDPQRLKLEEAEVLNWGDRQIDVRPKLQPLVPRRAAPQPADKAKEAEAANQRIRNELKKLAEVAFTDTPLRDVMLYVGDYHNIPIKFDESLKEQLDDLGKVPVTLTVTGEDLDAVLSRILHNKRLSYFVDAGELRFATPDEVRRLGHAVPTSFADTLAKLQKAEPSVPWEKLLLGHEHWGAEAYASRDKHLETLTKLLNQSDVDLQRHSAYLLARFEELAAPARSALEKLTKSPDLAVRRAAWNALLAMGRNDLSTWPLFLAAWNNSDEVVRDQWIKTLATFHPKVFDELLTHFPTGSVEFRRACSFALVIRRDQPSYEKLAILAMSDEDEETRYQALRQARSESRSQPFLSSWRRRLKDDSPRCRLLAAEYLMPLESDHLDALAVLLEEIRSADKSRSQTAARVLSEYALHVDRERLRDRLLRQSLAVDEQQRTAARMALKVVPESPGHSAILQEIDSQFASIREDQRFSLAKRLEIMDEWGRDRMSPKDSEELRARVGHHLARYFANWDLVAHNARVRDYCLAALKLDIDPNRRANLFSLAGSAALVDPAETTLAEQRRNAAKLWLAGYREVASLKLPKTAPELPVVEKLGDINGDSLDEQAERQQRHAAQVEARQQAEFIRQMIEHRHQLARLCVETYQRNPTNEPELRQLAMETLIEKPLVDALLAEGAVPLGAKASLPKDSGERGGVSPPVPSKANAESTPNNRGADAAPLANKVNEAAPLAKLVEPDDQPRRKVIERGIEFLKAKQQENGSWQGNPVDGVTALAAAALLQAGVKADDPVIQKTLAHLRKVEPALSYTVALQTMVFCWASPKEDAALIRRNVAWLEKAQVPDGKSRGAWSYQANPNGRGDGSCSRFAMLGLDAAKKAGFEVKEETWRRASDYWLTSQKENGGWGYTAESPPTLSMTLAGIAGLATANRHLPRDEQSNTREAAIRKPAEYIEKSMSGLPNATFVFYVLHSLERAGHLSGNARFGELDWKADATKRLQETQQPDGSWKGTNAAEESLIATSFALLVLTGQAELKQNARAEHKVSRPASQSATGLTDLESQQAVERWREATEHLAAYEAEFDRWEYDYVFNELKRGEGTFRWQRVDSWRLELRAPKIKPDPVAEVPHWKTGEVISFRTQANEPEVWSRSGQNIALENPKLADQSPFKRHVLRLPEVMPRPTGFWEKLAMTPMLAAASHFQNPCLLFPPPKRAIYDVSGNALQDNVQLLHLRPRGNEASDDQDLQVLLDQHTSLPRSVRMADPAGTKVTVIRFRTPHIEWRSDRAQK